mmetsp:Transcript_113168/g.330772  ORF Transcript_113168/g.330772 Transcript_113168/m.330772 type:complete len:162 (-) Transcript_113168:78-563(-)
MPAFTCGQPGPRPAVQRGSPKGATMTAFTCGQPGPRSPQHDPGSSRRHGSTARQAAARGRQQPAQGRRQAGRGEPGASTLDCSRALRPVASPPRAGEASRRSRRKQAGRREEAGDRQTDDDDDDDDQRPFTKDELKSKTIKNITKKGKKTKMRSAGVTSEK